MTSVECEKTADSLVDFADGELPAVESALVAEHLAGCASCRQELDALRRSLDAAQILWRDAETELTAAGEPRARSGSARRRTALIAASVLLLLSGGLLWKAATRQDDSISPASTAPSLAEIERQIHLAALPVQMLGAANFLAEQAGGQEIACQRYEYIAATYPDSHAAIESRERHLQLCGEGDLQ
jgi:predicted anti-sigma-YlaC factor YlaD